MIRFTWIFFIVAVTSVSCRSPRQYNNARPELAHAVLRGTKYPNAGMVFPSHINRQRTSFWRSSNQFRIAPGTNICQIAFSSRKETVGYATVEFMAEADSTYEITRSRAVETDSSFSASLNPLIQNGWIVHDWRDRAIIHEIGKEGLKRRVAETPRQVSIFGADSASEAIAIYRRENR